MISLVQFLIFAISTAGAYSQPIVQTKNGTYAGVGLPGFAQDFWGGIPFSQPAQRLMPALSLNASFTEVRQATDYGVGCAGIGGDDTGLVLGEDCLTLNVVRPSGTTSKSKLPVMVWIYGGGFVDGTTNNPRYNGSFIVQRSVNMSKPIIFISLGYRVNVFGFPVGDEATQAGILNLGLQDQRLALRYISENVEAFGGDPSKVTIMGESAGGASVYLHALAFGGRDDHLFRAAITQSGYWAPSAAFNRSAIYNATWTNLLKATGCGNLQCIRTLPFQQLNSSLARVGGFGPLIDNDFILHHPAKQFHDGDFVKVPLLCGANSDEGTAFLTPGINTDDQLQAAITTRNGTDFLLLNETSVQQILTLYPDDPSQGIPLNTGDGILASGFQDKRSAAFFGDAVIIASRRAAAQTFSKSNKVFSYRFNQPAFHVPITTGATHFSEVAYVFNNPNDGPASFSNTGLGPRQQDKDLGLLMSSMWISFVHDLNPNNNQVAHAPEWPEYGSTGGKHIVFQGFGSGSFVEEDNFRQEGIQFIIEQTEAGVQAL